MGILREMREHTCMPVCYCGTAEPGAMIKRTDMKLTSYLAFAPYLDHRTSKRYR